MKEYLTNYNEPKQEDYISCSSKDMFELYKTAINTLNSVIQSKKNLEDELTSLENAVDYICDFSSDQVLEFNLTVTEGEEEFIPLNNAVKNSRGRKDGF